MTVFLARHGEDRAAAAGRFGDEGLSPAGVEQARALARGLAKVDFSACLVSPLRRAAETARLVIGDREIPVRVEPLLAEGALGRLEGLGHQEAAARFPGDLRLGPSVMARIASSGRTAPGGEPRSAFLARARAASRLVLSEAERAGSSVLVISHGGLLNYLLQVALGMAPRDEVPFGFDHCGVIRLLGWREGRHYGPFPMLRFGPPPPGS